MSPDMQPPAGLMEAFWRYERALADDDLATLDQLFADGPDTLRGDRGGLLAGHDSVAAFRRYRRGAGPREIVDIRLQPAGDGYALVVAVTAPRRGGRGLQTQLWGRGEHGWVIRAAHISHAPLTFDPAVWRAVGDPLATGADSGPLAGEAVAVKDLFAVAGFATGAGVPQYLAEQPPAARDAAAVRLLLDAGATVRGITRTDQFAYSIDGDNPHYGTPVNAIAAGALPGGSSSGCATAVALGAATIGLGTDTAGSIRVPAAYQGLWGLRTTHGSVPTDGLLPLAPDFDAVGLLTRTPRLLATAAQVLTAPGDHPGPVIGWHEVRPGLPPLEQCYHAFRLHQAYQAWQVHGGWLSAHPDALSGSVRDRFAAAALVRPDQDARARGALSRFRAQLDDLLGDRVLVMPTTAGPPPRLWSSPAEREASRQATLQLTCLAAITGRPAVHAPRAGDPDGPPGLSFLGPAGTDACLVGLAERFLQP